MKILNSLKIILNKLKILINRMFKVINSKNKKCKNLIINNFIKLL
jgi:hypothetical protein